MRKLKHFLVGCVGLGMLFALVTLICYFVTFPGGLSEKTSDWANFGALLAGVFTLTGSLLTALTLLIIHEENRKSGKAREQQCTALTFEQYTSHRALFIEMLNQTASECGRKIKIHNQDILYGKIFANNNPTNIDQYQIDLTKEAQPGDLRDILARHENLRKSLQNNTDVALEALKLYSILNIKCTDDLRNGDLEFNFVNTGINIYYLYNSIQDAESIINALLRFTGNNPVGTATIHVNNYVQKALINGHPLNEPRNGFHVYRSELVNTVEKIYLHALNRSRIKWRLPNTYQFLIMGGEFWKVCLTSEQESINTLLMLFSDDQAMVDHYVIDEDNPDFIHYRNICSKMDQLRSLLDP